MTCFSPVYYRRKAKHLSAVLTYNSGSVNLKTIFGVFTLRWLEQRIDQKVSSLRSWVLARGDGV